MRTRLERAVSCRSLATAASFGAWVRVLPPAIVSSPVMRMRRDRVGRARRGTPERRAPTRAVRPRRSNGLWVAFTINRAAQSFTGEAATRPASGPSVADEARRGRSSRAGEACGVESNPSSFSIGDHAAVPLHPSYVVVHEHSRDADTVGQLDLSDPVGVVDVSVDALAPAPAGRALVPRSEVDPTTAGAPRADQTRPVQRPKMQAEHAEPDVELVGERSKVYARVAPDELEQIGAPRMGENAGSIDLESEG